MNLEHIKKCCASCQHNLVSTKSSNVQRTCALDGKFITHDYLCANYCLRRAMFEQIGESKGRIKHPNYIAWLVKNVNTLLEKELLPCNSDEQKAKLHALYIEETGGKIYINDEQEPNV